MPANTWFNHFDHLFADHAGVIFGHEARDDIALAGDPLTAMMREQPRIPSGQVERVRYLLC
jgi:hypothetical protein